MGSWSFHLLPSLIWITAMFLTCLVFNGMKRRSGSIIGEVLSHAGFNFCMGFLIFYAL